MEYSIVKRENPLKRDVVKFYPTPVWNKEISLRELAEEISNASSVNQADVSAVVEALITLIPNHIMNGQSVRLGDLGIMKLSFEASGEDKAEKVSSKNIKRKKIIFRPSTIIKDKLEKTFCKRYEPRNVAN